MFGQMKKYKSIKNEFNRMKVILIKNILVSIKKKAILNPVDDKSDEIVK